MDKTIEERVALLEKQVKELRGEMDEVQEVMGGVAGLFRRPTKKKQNKKGEAQKGEGEAGS